MPRRTPHGDPDISGTFTFRTLTPLNRPTTLEGQETLSEEEAAAFEASERRRLNRDLFDPETGQPTAGYQSRAEGGVLSYNEFSYERGVELTKDKRTSLVVDPPDGRVPYRDETQEKSRVRRLNLRNGFADSYTDRSLSDRCLMGFNSGPPMVSRGYNNNVQILVERFRRLDGDTVIYEFTVEDPNSFTRPWTAMIPFRRTDGPLYEYACHEGNIGMHGIMAGARLLDTQAVDASSLTR